MAFPILYEKTVTDPTANGYGFGMLSNCLECIIKETLNGDYTLEMKYTSFGIHAEEIKEGRIIWALRDNSENWQMFRITEITTNYIEKEISVFAQHVSRDLHSFPCPQTSYNSYPKWITALNASTYYGLTSPFTFYNSGNYADTNNLTGPGITASVYDLLLSEDGIVKEGIGGLYNGEPMAELEFDNFDVKFWKTRGTDQNITVRYGKNLTGLQSVAPVSDIPFGTVPFYLKDDGQIIYGDLKTCTLFDDDDPIAYAIEYYDCTSEVQEEIEVEEATDAQILAQVNTEGTHRKNTLNREHAKLDGVTIDFEYLDMANAAEYWSGPKPQASTADIGDYVTVIYPDLDIDTKSEILEVEYDSLNERYNKITAGQIRPTLSQTITTIAKRANKRKLIGG